MVWRARFAGAVCVALLAGCGGKPPVPPTIVSVSVSAATSANPGPDGTAAPVVVRIYQLAGTGAFENAEFFPLYNGDAAVLGTDLVKRQDVPLAPGQTVNVSLQPGDTVTAIGVFAGLRGFQSATWHADVPITPHAANKLAVTVGAAGVGVAAVK